MRQGSVNVLTNENTVLTDFVEQSLYQNVHFLYQWQAIELSTDALKTITHRLDLCFQFGKQFANCKDCTPRNRRSEIASFVDQSQCNLVLVPM